jgi:hypothetical protein
VLCAGGPSPTGRHGFARQDSGAAGHCAAGHYEQSAPERGIGAGHVRGDERAGETGGADGPVGGGWCARRGGLALQGRDNIQFYRHQPAAAGGHKPLAQNRGEPGGFGAPTGCRSRQSLQRHILGQIAVIDQLACKILAVKGYSAVSYGVQMINYESGFERGASCRA